MGCYNVLCCISDMVICAGDEIVMFNLNKKREGLWVIEDYPEFGEYGEYGDIYDSNLQQDEGSVYIHKAIWNHAIEVGKNNFIFHGARPKGPSFEQDMELQLKILNKDWVERLGKAKSPLDSYRFEGYCWTINSGRTPFSYLLCDSWEDGWNQTSNEFRHRIRLEIVKHWEEGEGDINELSQRLSDMYHFLIGVSVLNREIKPMGYARFPGQCYLSKEEVDVSVEFHKMCIVFQKTRQSQCEEEE